MGGGYDDSDMLDLVYDAAVEPALWTSVIERLAELTGGGGGVMVDQNQENGLGAAIVVGADPSVLTPYFGYYASRNVLLNVADPRAFMRCWTPRILTDEDWLPKDELLRSEYYNDYLRPIDVHAVLMIRLAARGINAVNINIGRPKRSGRFAADDIARAERLHPHLIRAYHLGRKLDAARQVDASAVELLDRSPYGLIILNEDGAVHHANRIAEDLIVRGDGLTVVGGRLCSSSAEATRRLQALISAAASADPERRSGGSMPLRTPTRRLPLSVMVAPARSRRLAVFQGGPSVMVCVTDPEAGVSLPEQRLRELFDLTAAETRVALALLEGRGPREAAAKLGLSFYTVRCHLARIFDKTGTNRQAELVRLMMSAIGAWVE
ncbi:MAG TPA: helix-turn-helix transcriptional regulator [Caulobacteraceae bacterium]|jgi:DNA-binding CsgD family transcriptional regulator